MKNANLLWWLSALLISGLLAACGGSINSSDSGSLPSSVTSGIAVDPYIVNAIFEEVSADGSTIIQYRSTPSDSLGRFRFPDPVREGSIIRIKASGQGMHGNAPYQGILKRRVSAGDDDNAVVSPLTTVLANGASEADLLDLLTASGINGLAASELKDDPMAGLVGATGQLNATELELLQANMAINTMMLALADFDYSGNAEGAVNLADCVALSRDLLDANAFNAMSGRISNDLGGSFLFDDLAVAAVEVQRTVVARIQQDLASGSTAISSARFDELRSNAMASLPIIARDICAARLDAAAVAFDPATYFSENCAVCHNLGSSTGTMNLVGDGNLLDTKFGNGVMHNGNALNPDEILSLAGYLDGTGPVEPPPAPATGAELYASECQGCHGSLATTNIGNRTVNGINAAIAANAGGMGNLALSGDQILLIADALSTVNPPPTTNRTGAEVYDQECSGCHALGSHDSAGNLDLAGKGNLIVTKIEGGHNGKVLTAAELLALADFADTFIVPPPPVTTRSAETIYNDICGACHMLSTYDDVGNIDLAGMGSMAMTKVNGGHGGALSIEELTGLAAWLDTFEATDPYAGSCDACHGQPPTVGAHVTHAALAGVGTDCAVCHENAGHNGAVDLAFPATWDAQSGPADSNGRSCSNIRCHGGLTTPDWSTGSLNSNTQCKSCHEYGTSQYNGYFSGQHRRHAVNRGYDCSTCHDAARLANGHFGNLATTLFELSPASTIRSSLSYTGGTCQTPGCHGSERW